MTENSESEIIEKLNSASTVRGFFITAVEVISESIDSLLQRIFRKEEFSAQNVVKSLLNESGPLGELSDRLKLLFGIGVLPNDLYLDIEDIIKIRDNLSQDVKEYSFTDTDITNSLKQLRLINKNSVIPLELMESDQKDDSSFQEIQFERQRQVIKSGLSLAIVDICVQLDKYPLT